MSNFEISFPELFNFSVVNKAFLKDIVWAQSEDTPESPIGFYGLA